MLSTTDKISFKERQILIHSYIYYNLDQNRISDMEYDKLSYSLVDMMKRYPDEFKQSEYYENFKDFDASSGFGLYESLNEKQKEMIEVIAHFLCRCGKSKKSVKS